MAMITLVRQETIGESGKVEPKRHKFRKLSGLNWNLVLPLTS